MKTSVSLSTEKSDPHSSAAKGGDHQDRKAAAASLTPEQLHGMIAEEAYLRAERRGFQNGDPTSDWLTAEEEVTRLLTRNLQPGTKG